MNNYTKLLGIACISTALVACGGGSSGGIDKPNDVPNETAPAPTDLSDNFVPFKPISLSDQFNKLFKRDLSQSQADIDYNKALGHMIGEVFGDYPYLRTARVVKIYDMAKTSVTLGNLFCADVVTVNNTKTLTLKANKDTCIVGGNTLNKGSEISVTTDGDLTTVKLKNVLFGSNVDFNLKAKYLVDGEIQHLDSVAKESFTIPKLEYQVLENAVSKEYLQVKDYKYVLEHGSEKRELTTQGLVLGQPKDTNFTYYFSYRTVKALEMPKTLLGYKHFPNAGGSIEIMDSYTNAIEIKQMENQATSANLYVNGKEAGTLSWTDILGNK